MWRVSVNILLTSRFPKLFPRNSLMWGHEQLYMARESGAGWPPLYDE